MQLYRILLEPKSAFGTPLKGDTLFGQLCWAIVNRYGEGRLQELLDSYPTQPFTVCSDGFPGGYFPRPSLPTVYFDVADNEGRKASKKKRWIPLDDLMTPVSMWLVNAKSDAELMFPDKVREQPHNSINRLTGTTGEGMFAPYSQLQLWYPADVKFDIYLLFDDVQLSLTELLTLFDDVGSFGYGRDASIGMGKFKILDHAVWDFSVTTNANACLTLSPCAPQGLELGSKHSYYNVFTRFGKHGDLGVHGKHGPFKAPVLLADTGAVFSPIAKGQHYIGQGLGGRGQLSRAIPATVHQGYAPYIPVHLPVHKQAEAT